MTINHSTNAAVVWMTSFQDAVAEARRTKRPILIDVWQDDCGGCERLADETFTDPEVIAVLNERFIPLSLHLFNDRAITREWGIFWTPTVLFADRSGKVRYTSINYVPAGTMLDILDIGEAMVHMRWKEHGRSIALLRAVERRHPDGPMTAEALYWRGIAEYFRDGNVPASAKRVWAEITRRFPDSIWAERQP